jgi:hypothetical protein
LVRQWVLLRTLSARHHGASVEELAEELAVSGKTIRRDLRTFQAAGFPLEETVEQFGRKRWRNEPARNQPGLSFAFDEAVALYLARRLMEPPVGTPFWEAAQRAFRKIRATLGSEALRHVERFAELFHQTMVGVSDYAKKAELMDQSERNQDVSACPHNPRVTGSNPVPATWTSVQIRKGSCFSNNTGPSPFSREALLAFTRRVYVVFCVASPARQQAL